jgi:superfamily I DNA and/or RNA helicase
VALSRAKKGLYVIGNFEQLKTKSKLWEKIVDDAIKREFLDNRLELIQVIAVLYHFLPPENYQRLLF